MKIYWKDYMIEADTYNWMLYTKNIIKKDTFKKDGTYSRKKGEAYYVEAGFFNNLDTLLNKIVRLETEKESKDMQLSEFLILWYDIVKSFTEQCKVIKEGKNE